MNSPLLQLLVLAGIAIFLILRLKSVLGTRDGYEPSQQPRPSTPAPSRRQDFEVIDGGPDFDITDHVAEGSDSAKALADMKRADSSFAVGEFLQGAKQAYEWILMAFERGQMEEIKPFLDEDVYEAFKSVVDSRAQQGLTVEAEFIGVRETTLTGASFDNATNSAEITVRFIGELVSVVRDQNGEIVEGEPGKSKKQKDSWTFERVMGSDDPNWRLVATGE
ncbi:Tim44-like domain protein [Roseovarius sp. THAF27]|uniref:Tim44/TimA family putative adaptor protein n=1 Tax=Roseovarius sp. THAF27 TaxID=2587850 RepID=UPI00126971CC|nr:Tim44/TimA family putative adaptor protein [Roseovarius sp. THAF27]QFT82982.1 Tim44-like domain protein [Roseovarius sp. THAF27]